MVSRVGILAAIPQERAALEAQMAQMASKDGFALGTIDGHAVCVGSTGIGKVNAAVAATRLCERFAPLMVVFSGVAGGLDPELGIGDVVIGTNVIQHDAGVLTDGGIETYQAGHIPFFNPTERLGFQPSPKLLESVRSALGEPPMRLGAGGRIAYGTILTGDQFLASDSERARLHHRFDGLAIEMECGAVAQVADEYGIDHLAIRTISDRAGAGSPIDFTEFLDTVAHQTVQVLRRILPALHAS